MDCPVCKTTALVMSERQGIEIDYCPQCRGVWLDRGELDKLIERAAPAASAPPATPPAAPGYPPAPGYDPRQSGYGNRERHAQQGHGGYDSYGRKKKKEGFLSDLFDF
ncbi:MAG: zf-TFIIB domain-containing protein [Pseudoxanthomonas sp.]